MRKLITLIAIGFCLSMASHAQGKRRVVVLGELRSKILTDADSSFQTLSLESRFLKRTVFFTVVLPAAYSDKKQNGRIFRVVYLLHGLDGHFDNWCNKASLVAYATELNLIIVTPEGGDGWYTDSATTPNDKFETYLLEEVIPEVEGRYRIIRDRRGRAIAGLSMGGYGAMKFGLKYPDMFYRVGSFSGALAAPFYTEENSTMHIGRSSVAVFGQSEDTRRANDVFRLLRDMDPVKVKKLPFIYLSCGTEDMDFIFKNNRDFDALLLEKKVPHEYRELPGTHSWDFWTSQLDEFFRSDK